MKQSGIYQRQFDFIDTEEFFSILKGQLDERTFRLVVAAMARAQNRFNLTRIAKCADVSRSRIYRGITTLDKPALEKKKNGDARLRERGGGRKTILEKVPQLRDEILRIVEPHTRGNPEVPLRWASKSLAKIKDVLSMAGHKISTVTIGKILHKLGYTLQSCKKSHERGQSPDRDAQFKYIAATTAEFQLKGQPVISIDTKKKELVGNFKNAGRDYHPKGSPPEVEGHDFMTEDGRATPYGVYDLTYNEGFVNVGLGPDTAEFAVESIQKWWDKMGRSRYPDAHSIYLTADGGGSNGSRNRLWKKAIREFAIKNNLIVTVSHYPPGTSKWNKIEHRMFSFISQNWRGRPLTSIDVIVNLIANTTNRDGLKIKAEFSDSIYETGVEVRDEEIEGLIRHPFCPNWNYTFKPD